MNTTYNIYCDESCHLENDRQDIMVLGAVWHPLEQRRKISEEIRDVKRRNSLGSTFEIKWAKVSPAKVSFYLDVVDYFFGNKDLCFRALVVPDKSKLRHKDFQQTHDEWYYKMYFTLLKVILDPKCRYRIYLDIKDTQSKAKTDKLRDVLCSNLHDSDRNIIENTQPVHSYEIEQIQLADLLIGAISYINRNLSSSSAKNAIVERIKHHSGYSLTRTTIPKERKCNIFVWHPQEDEDE